MKYLQLRGETFVAWQSQRYHELRIEVVWPVYAMSEAALVLSQE